MSSSHEAISSSKLAADLNLPSRPPTASTPLWAHILRPNSQVPTSLSDVRVVAPPTGPLDKNATSMRVLLHDTQANFEKFTDHVAKLTDGIKETKHEMKVVHSLFERDRESLMGDIIDLVNRAQKEIQKCVGSPCQTETVETFFKDINHRLQGLDQRLEAMQSVVSVLIFYLTLLIAFAHRTSRSPSVNRRQQGPVSIPLLRTPSTTLTLGAMSTSVSELFGTRIESSGKTDLEQVERLRNRSAPPVDPSNILGITPTAARPPRMLRMHTSLATRNNPNPAAAIGAQDSSVTLAPADVVPSTSVAPKSGLQLIARENLLGRRQNTLSPLNVTDRRSSPLGLGGSNMGIMQHSPLSRSHSRSGSVSRAITVDPLAIFNRHSTPAPVAEAPKQENVEHDAAPLLPPPNRAQVQSTAARSRSQSASVLSVGMPVPRPKGKNTSLAAALGRMKERRSPVRDGRRFIPLMDSEDDDDDNS
ncbi:hypothetical protein NLJ89_g8707 [Agrocybe chaxingu]|uniref:Uncharacterized protein n=1 Tax=Agrocybe chaxingu TaxID=84603 RepID=A0A9W8MRX2_9AGAR|nr:hypothetical protein NLJ89_g8707 [Agrocybe chaxingu]